MRREVISVLWVVAMVVAVCGPCRGASPAEGRDSSSRVTAGDSLPVADKGNKKSVVREDSWDWRPQFKGGDAALRKYLTTNIRYPAAAVRNGIEGRVVVSFTVEPDGSVGEVSVLKGVHPLLDQAAVRLVSEMPRWIPAKRNGEAARVKYHVPVVFNRIQFVDSLEVGTLLPLVGRNAALTVPVAPDGGEPVDEVEMPRFPGGDEGLHRYLSENVSYPTAAVRNEIEGRVVVSFVVGKEGQISNVTVEKSVDPLLDQEAVRLVKGMPRWTPGKRNGEAVRVRYHVPITFSLKKSNTKSRRTGL